MSLVAYTFSGSEGESSEDEDVPFAAVQEEKGNLEVIGSSPFSNLPAPRVTSKSIDVKINSSNLFSEDKLNKPIIKSNVDLEFSTFETHEGEFNPNLKLKNFSTLPPPKNKPSQFVEEGDLEEEVRDKSFFNVPLVKKKEGRVKITLPAIPDPDSDDDEPKKKKKKQFSGSSGLFASLPEPKNMTTKEANRPLIPHTLSKKTPSLTPVNTPKSLKKQEINPSCGIQGLSVYDGGDEGDEEETTAADFFSLSSVKTEPPPNKIPNSNILISNLPTDLDNDFNWTTPNPEVMDFPLNFNKKPTSTILENYSKTETQYNYSDSNTKAFNYVDNQTYSDADFQNNVDYLQDKEFQRLQGKKHYGKEEINIIDVNADDQISDSQNFLTKSLSEEKEYRSSRKKGELPTVQQRRKHQITYLAFQAKERELELKNQWSQNRLTRKQTQSKYGF